MFAKENEKASITPAELDLLSLKKLKVLCRPEKSQSLMRSLSACLFFSQNFSLDLQRLCVSVFQFHPEFRNYRMKTQMEYQMTPFLPEFDDINVKLISLVKNRQVKVWFVVDG